jgi:hypothetical protein
MLRVQHKRAAAASLAGVVVSSAGLHLHLKPSLPWIDQSLHKMFEAIQAVML